VYHGQLNPSNILVKPHNMVTCIPRYQVLACFVKKLMFSKIDIQLCHVSELNCTSWIFSLYIKRSYTASVTYSIMLMMPKYLPAKKSLISTLLIKIKSII